ncbi:MAG TPA: iron ABC transporter permease [Paracoccus sp. (in: a-proteobacteria)]|uniref:ABC transporter permease n=1 Tax=Paracoccus sp. TaxID=267 RepID=UPI002B5113ED|nr:iron ABC transporter permease [Paracoccus sp. (in: a-proteobacteria)]HWL56982.1 iron ABC transporter permease [Paracoccus sp. (in: a-proteobacteria)]
MNADNRRLDRVLAGAILALLILPWYRVKSGFFSLEWVGELFSRDALWPGALQALAGRWQLWPVLVLVALTIALRATPSGAKRGRWLIWIGVLGLIWMATQGLSVGTRGWNWGVLEQLFGEIKGQQAFGAGAIITGLIFTCLISFGLAERGALKGDAFILTAISLLILLVAVFVLYPILSIFTGAFQDVDGSFTAAGVRHNIVDPKIWSLSCLTGGACGVAWRTLFLAILTATATTLLGLACALVATRTGFPFKKGLRLLTILPIITPPFVVGLALTMLLGRSGTVTQLIQSLTGIELGRWLYGLTGIWLAQVLSFTPVSFLVLIGVVEGVSPSMEEASQTLRAGRWRTFRKVSLPLMAPGLANAFLIGFIESMADFGNPLVLGGSGGVLSTEIFFSVVGAQNDPSRAAALAAILLVFTLSAFLAQRLWLSGKNFATVGGKGDGGSHAALPARVAWPVITVVSLWVAFTVVVYAMILFGGFVKLWGLDHSLTIDHYIRAFGISFDGGIRFTGVAWNSFWTTMMIALIAAPLTAAVGLLTAWLIARQRFPGKGIFEFVLMMSFAIPGTVIGISYIMAFNLPPIQMTGTALILIICFVFRNMPVGVRGGVAAMSQIDGSLDEASLTLGATSGRTLRRVILPLLKPAITASLVYSFVRAITSISAVIFLVSAKYNMATSYIVGLVENGQYGVAIAYSSALIVVMIAVIGVFQMLVGERKLRRPKTAPQKVSEAVT